MNILVLNFGGNTFDVNVVEISCYGVYEIKSIISNIHMGGQDIDT